MRPIGHPTDATSRAFQGKAGTGARLSIASNSGGIDPYVEIWDPSGASFDTLSCSGGGCTGLLDIDFTQTGIYRVAVSDGGLDAIGDYTLGVTASTAPAPSAHRRHPSPSPRPTRCCSPAWALSAWQPVAGRRPDCCPRFGPATRRAGPLLPAGYAIRIQTAINDGKPFQLPVTRLGASSKVSPSRARQPGGACSHLVCR